MLFQSDIEILKSEITNFEAIIATRRARIEQLNYAETVADGAIQSLQDAVTKFQELAPDAIATLKSAVLGLFGGNDSSDGDDPAPDPDPTPNDDLTEIEQWEEDNGILTNIDGDDDLAVPVDEETIPPVNAAATDEPSDSYADQSVRPYVEMLSLNETVAYQRKRDGEIICAYLGTSTNQLAKQWVSTLELWGCSAEIRKPKRITGSKWEIKIKNADITRLTKLAESHPAFNSGVPAPKSESLELVQDIPETSSENSTKCDATTNPSASVELRFNDEVLIESDSVPGLRGKIGQVKTIGSNWIGVECEGRLHEFFATELTLISGVEPPQPKTVNAAFKAIASWSPYSSKRIG